MGTNRAFWDVWSLLGQILSGTLSLQSFLLVSRNPGSLEFVMSEEFVMFLVLYCLQAIRLSEEPFSRAFLEPVLIQNGKNYKIFLSSFYLGTSSRKDH